MMNRLHQRTIYALGGISIIALLALAVDVSDTAGYTLDPWRPVTLHLGLDLAGGVRVLLRASPRWGHPLDDRVMEETRQIIANRIDNGLDVSEPVIQTLTRDHRRFVSIEMASTSTAVPATVAKLAQRTGRLTLAALNGPPPRRGSPLRRYRLLAQGSDILPSSVALGLDWRGRAVIDLALRASTAARIDTYMARSPAPFVGVAIDDRIYEVRPSRHVFVDGRFQITRADPVIPSNSITTVTSLATTLRYGALPVSLEIVGVQKVGSMLGTGAVRALIMAGAAGLGAVFLLFVLLYRLSGLLAATALAITGLIVVAVVKLTAVALTLSSLAGLTLAFALAAHANMLILQRIREEVSTTRGAAIGIVRAWRSIQALAATTVTTSVILWWIGTTLSAGRLASFAAGLFIGASTSILVVALVSRTLLRLAAASD